MHKPPGRRKEVERTLGTGGFGDVLAADRELLIVTPLGVLGAAAGDTTVNLLSIHPGVDFADIQTATGFSLDPVQVTTQPPTLQELAQLRAQLGV